MVTERFRINDKLLVEQNENGFALKQREEIGRGKRFGMDGTIHLGDSEAETFAKWVLAHQIESEIE